MYVILRKRDDKYIGHAFRLEKPAEALLNDTQALESAFEDAKSKDTIKSAPNKPPLMPADYSEIIDSFNSIIETYRTMIMSTIDLSPWISLQLANANFGEFIAEHGNRIDSFNDDKFSIYEIEETLIPSIFKREESLKAALNGSKHLPEVAIIGLISVYDAYLGNLIRHILTTNEKLTFTSEKKIKYSDLISYGNIDEAKTAIIESETDSALRGSHTDQIKWMEQKFKIKLGTDKEIWPDFIELCERRNLLTHTGGRVSNQYIKNCSDAGKNVNEQIGDSLSTDIKYLKKAISIIHEYGLKIGYVLWRKLNPKNSEDADNHLNNTAVELINHREYALAENLLSTAIAFPGKQKEMLRRMIIINLANAKRLQGKTEEAIKVLEEEDWSAAAAQLQLCMYSVKGEIDKVCELMHKVDKSEISETEYQDWPVFIQTREHSKFQENFKIKFGRPIYMLPSSSSKPALIS